MLNKYMKEVKAFMIREGEKRKKKILHGIEEKKKIKTKRTRSQETYIE